MARLIDKDALPVSKEYIVDEAGFGASFYVVHKSDIDNAPTVDAVEVVRCKDCRFYEKVEYYHPIDDRAIKTVCRLFKRQMHPDDYCSYGERKESE